MLESTVEGLNVEKLTLNDRLTQQLSDFNNYKTQSTLQHIHHPVPVPVRVCVHRSRSPPRIKRNHHVARVPHVPIVPHVPHMAHIPLHTSTYVPYHTTIHHSPLHTTSHRSSLNSHFNRRSVLKPATVTSHSKVAFTKIGSD